MSNTNEQIAKEVLKAIGGKENIQSVTHCMTRLRFVLNNAEIPNQEEIKKLNGVLGVVISGGQFQVIIGQNVPKVYAALCKEAGIKGQKEEKAPQNASREEKTSEVKEKLTPKKIGSNILNYLAGSMTPLIPAMLVAAMFKTIQVVFGPDMLGVLSAESDMYLLCGFIYNAFFYFLPVFLGYTASKKIGLNPVMGMLAACLLLVPDFVNLASEGTAFTVYGIPCRTGNYSQTVLPIILTVWVMHYVYKFFEKYIPDVLATVFVPFLTMLVMVPIELCALAPIGSVAGDFVGNGLLAFGDVGGFLAIAVVAALWEFLVISGMHAVLVVFAMTALMENGVDNFILVAAGLATWAAYGMALGAFLRIKNKEEKSLALGYFISGILGGVTEPVLYGVGFRYKRPFVALAVGGAIGGLYAGITHVGLYAMGATNFLHILTFVGGSTANFVNACIAVALSFFGTALITYFYGFKKIDLAE